MSEVHVLRGRVEQAATGLQAAQDQRRQANQELMDMLARLEERFVIQARELERYRLLTAPLEAANRELAELIESLLEVVEQGIDGAAADGFAKASALASELLNGAESPSAVEPDEVAIQFEDVSGEELAAEEMADDEAYGDAVVPRDGADSTAPEEVSADVSSSIKSLLAKVEGMAAEAQSARTSEHVGASEPVGADADAPPETARRRGVSGAFTKS